MISLSCMLNPPIKVTQNIFYVPQFSLMMALYNAIIDSCLLSVVANTLHFLSIA